MWVEKEVKNVKNEGERRQSGSQNRRRKCEKQCTRTKVQQTEQKVVL